MMIANLFLDLVGYNIVAFRAYEIRLLKLNDSNRKSRSDIKCSYTVILLSRQTIPCVYTSPGRSQDDHALSVSSQS